MPLKLPKLRDGLTLTFSDYDPDGKPQWVIYDAGRNKFFVIGWVEYEILKRWEMADAEKIIEDITNKSTLHIEPSDIEAVIQFLAQNYLIKQSGYQIYKHAKDQKLFKDENILHWLISYYLFFRIPLWHPNKFLTRTQGIADIIFSRYMGYVMVLLGLVAVNQISNRWTEFTHTFSSIFNWNGLFFYLIAFLLCKFCHELGHAYMCKRYGIPVPTFGVAFLVFWPVLYTDTTLSWSLNSKQRMRIALAGMWVETYVTIIAALIWCNSSDTTVKSITYIIITVNWLSSLLINVSPFMRFDGYYVLADYLKIPNLQARAFALTRWQLRRWLFDWPDPPPERFSTRTHCILVIYSFITWVYRLVLYLGIAILVYHFFIKIIGILLFIIELFYFIFAPIVAEIKLWIRQRDRFKLNTHTIVTLSICSFLIILFFLPINSTTRLPATLSYVHQFLIAPGEGVIESKIPLPGTHIQANQAIVTISSPELNYALKKIQLEYKKTLGELRRSTINNQFSNQQSALLSNIAKQEAENHKLLELRQELTLKIPFNGILIDVSPELYQGVTVRKDEWIGDVIDPNATQVEAYISQIDFQSIKLGMEGKFYPNDLSESSIPVKISSIEVINANQLICHYSSEIKSNLQQEYVVETPCYHSSDLGGNIATYLTNEGDLVPVNSVYRIVLKTLKPVKIQHIERGSVFIKVNSHSYAYRFIYKLKTILIEQSGL